MYRMAAMSTVVMMITTPMTMVMTMTMMMIMTNVEKLLSHRHQSTAATVHVYIHGSRYCSNGACLFLFCFLCFFSFSSSSSSSSACCSSPSLSAVMAFLRLRSCIAVACSSQLQRWIPKSKRLGAASSTFSSVPSLAPGEAQASSSFSEFGANVTGANFIAVSAPRAARAGLHFPNSPLTSRSFTSSSAPENFTAQTTVGDLLRSKGAEADGSWLFCTTEDSVFDAVKSMTASNVGALLVVAPGNSGAIAGIVTERDYLRKIIVQGRQSQTTKVGEIMTEENKLITVSPETKLIQAMELMTEHNIRHIPVCEGKKMRGMVSIRDVVKIVVEEHKDELQRLSEFIQGSY
eukprot:TRINITY_DN227_c0_g1_i12.p1 TRINITY_DN227_c0_g1~~TRINITY_DN227_c0_g1_i12.p1  ORF type:complete len:348 (-),score=72.35 TRINITY_DN227_c0_g1_i12:516-1559(-)